MFAFDPRQVLAHVTPIGRFAQTLQNLVPARHKGQDRVVTRGASRSPGCVRNPEIRHDHGNGHGTDTDRDADTDTDTVFGMLRVCFSESVTVRICVRIPVHGS